MASHQSDNISGCREIVEALFRKGEGCCHCHKRLSFVKCKGDEQASIEREIEVDCKYTDPRQKNHLCCNLCQKMFRGKPWGDRQKFHEVALFWIKQGKFDATASWEGRLKMAQDLEDFENLPRFDEKALRGYFNNRYMNDRCKFDVDDEMFFGNMTVDDNIALMRIQNFRDMNTGVRMSLDRTSILRPSPDKILVGGNYDNGKEYD